jgi:dolichyl-diphosphooligosaccharide--protein glycosyltransferase
MFPVVIGSLTTIVIFAFVRIISNFWNVCEFVICIYARNNSEREFGWFKSEPLGLFLGILSIYLFLSAIKEKNLRMTIVKVVGAGLILGLANASWGEYNILAYH